jgi:hypothetical protein
MNHDSLLVSTEIAETPSRNAENGSAHEQLSIDGEILAARTQGQQPTFSNIEKESPIERSCTYDETRSAVGQRTEKTATSSERPPALSAAALAARRANAQKATGPRTLAGKIRASQNARKHGRYCGQTRSLYGTIKKLVEESREFARVERGLRNSLLPTDQPQELLVHEIAMLRWERRRLERALAALLARRIQKLEIDRERRSLQVRDKTSTQIPTAQLTAGLLREKEDSPTKFQKLLEWLETLQVFLDTQEYGHAEEVIGWIYGMVPTTRGILIKELFCSLAKSKRTPDESIVSKLRLELQKEISDVAANYNLYLLEHGDLTARVLQERLAPTCKERVLIGEMTLIGRLIDQKVRLLLTLQKANCDGDKPRKVGAREMAREEEKEKGRFETGGILIMLCK